MKRKIKKYAEGKAVTTRSDDEIEWANSKPMGGAGQQYPGEGWKQREKEQGEKNWSAIKNFFGGKKEDSSSKFDELESVGGAGRRPRTIQEQISGKSEEAPIRNIKDYIKTSPKEEAKPAGTTHVNEGYKEEPAKKVKKVASEDKKSLGDKATRLPGNAADKDKKPTPLPGKDTKSTRMPIGYDKLDLRSSEEKYKPGISKERQEKADKAVYAGWRKNKIDMTKRKSAEDMKYDEQGNAYKRGGSVRKSASARADGCAIRGKTRA
jgi:hypothetical protein